MSVLLKSIALLSDPQAKIINLVMTYIMCNYDVISINIVISGLLTSFGKNSREALISKEPTKIVEKLSVNSRCNSIYKKLVSTPADISLQTVKNSVQVSVKPYRAKSINTVDQYFCLLLQDIRKSRCTA